MEKLKMTEKEIMFYIQVSYLVAKYKKCIKKMSNGTETDYEEYKSLLFKLEEQLSALKVNMDSTIEEMKTEERKQFFRDFFDRLCSIYHKVIVKVPDLAPDKLMDVINRFDSELEWFEQNVNKRENAEEILFDFQVSRKKHCPTETHQYAETVDEIVKFLRSKAQMVSSEEWKEILDDALNLL